MTDRMAGAGGAGDVAGGQRPALVADHSVAQGPGGSADFAVRGVSFGVRVVGLVVLVAAGRGPGEAGKGGNLPAAGVGDEARLGLGGEGVVRNAMRSVAMPIALAAAADLDVVDDVAVAQAIEPAATVEPAVGDGLRANQGIGGNFDIGAGVEKNRIAAVVERHGTNDHVTVAERQPGLGWFARSHGAATGTRPGVFAVAPTRGSRAAAAA